MARHGITAAGNWIVDHVKLIDTWPAEGMLANIRSEATGTGGAPYNVLQDIALLGAGITLAGVGRVGDDADGKGIRERCRSLGIDETHLRTDPAAPTSYTDVMTLTATRQRTFFHCRGANARFVPSDADPAALPGRILHLGYLLLLDGMDAADPVWGTAAAGWLASARAAGLLTSVDLVSEDSARYRSVVAPALKHVDYLILNEIEAGRTAGIPIRDRATLDQAAESLLSLGVQGAVVIHRPEGALWLDRQGRRIWQPSLTLPAGYIQGTAGAGDAFCAGILFGVHEGWEPVRALRFAHAMAALCLAHETCTGGMGPMPRVEELLRRYTFPAAS